MKDKHNNLNQTHKSLRYIVLHVLFFKELNVTKLKKKDNA